MSPYFTDLSCRPALFILAVKSLLFDMTSCLPFSQSLPPIFHTLSQLIQYQIIIGLERMNWLKEKENISTRQPRSNRLQHILCSYHPSRVILPCEGPVMIACAVSLLQMNDWEVRPGACKPGEIIIAGGSRVQGAGMSHVKAKYQWHPAARIQVGEPLRFLDAVSPFACYRHVLKQHVRKPFVRGIVRKPGQPFPQLTQKNLFALLLHGILNAECADVATHTGRSQASRKVDGTLIPACGRLAHRVIRMQQLAPRIGSQPGKSALNEDITCRCKLANSISVSHSRALVEQRVNQVEAKLAAIQPQLIFHNTHPLLWFRPTLDRKADIDTETQVCHNVHLLLMNAPGQRQAQPVRNTKPNRLGYGLGLPLPWLVF